jgi:hypothetical protein
VKAIGQVLCGVVLGVAGFAIWMRWYFRDVMK